jgi:quercetin dioxygenase-like cupin family protein
MIGHIHEQALKNIEHPSVKDASIRALVGPVQGWTDHVMRVLELGPHGYSPRHSHPWFHVNYIIEGSGTLEIDGVLTQIGQGSYAFVPGNALHQFSNTSDKPLRFLCIVPKEGHQG